MSNSKDYYEFAIYALTDFISSIMVERNIEVIKLKHSTLRSDKKKSIQTIYKDGKDYCVVLNSNGENSAIVNEQTSAMNDLLDGEVLFDTDLEKAKVSILNHTLAYLVGDDEIEMKKELFLSADKDYIFHIKNNVVEKCIEVLIAQNVLNEIDNVKYHYNMC